MECILPMLLALVPLTAQSQLSPVSQLALAEQIAAKAQRSAIWRDEAGNVTGLILINHQALTREAGEKPGINDADLARRALDSRGFFSFGSLAEKKNSHRQHHIDCPDRI